MLRRPLSLRSKPSLRTELLFNLAFLAAAALLLGIGTIILVGALAPGLTPQQLLPFIILVVLLDLAIFIVFGSYLVSRHVLRPLNRVITAADAVAGGNLQERAPDAETDDFSVLGQRLNRMTDHLLDAQGYLVRAEKLASIGRLAAGIAHEVGNPLGAISTYVEVLRHRGGDAEVTQGITREIERIDRIVRSLLDYAGPHEEALRPLDPVPVIRGAFGLLQSQGVLKRVRAHLDLSEDLPRILGWAHTLEQTIVNLVLNAVDAAPGGDVVVGARRWSYEPAHAPPRRGSDPRWTIFPRPPDRRPMRPDYQPGIPGILTFVADSGSGVPPEDRERVFEPFYTTKDPGRGTGLGLAIVQRAVYDMGGVVWVDTAREGGAAFKMFFPELRGAA